MITDLSPTYQSEEVDFIPARTIKNRQTGGDYPLSVSDDLRNLTLYFYR